MRLRPLQAFQATARNGSTTLAGEELGISQPAVSGLLSALERELGFRLFRRNKGRLQITNEGQAFLHEVETALAGIHRLADAARDIRELRRGELRVACLPGLSTTLMPRVVAQFLSERPEVRLFMETSSSPIVEEWIRTQQFDLGLAERTLDDSEIETDVIHLRCVAIVPTGHRLASRERLTPEDFAGEPFVGLKPDHFTRFHLDTAFRSADVRWNVQATTTLFTTACAMVAASPCLVSVVDPISACDWSSHGIVALPFEPEIPFEIKLLFPIQRPRSELTTALVSSLVEQISPFGVIDSSD